MKKHLTNFFVAVLCTLSAGVAGTLLAANNGAIETNAATSPTYNYASSLAGWWSGSKANNGQTVTDGKTTINFKEAGGIVSCNLFAPEAGKNYKFTFVGKSLGEGNAYVHFWGLEYKLVKERMAFATEDTTISFDCTWPADADGFMLQDTSADKSAILELATLKFEEIIPHTVSYVNSINYASSASYWGEGATLTDEGIKMSGTEGSVVSVYAIPNGYSFEAEKTYSISMSVKSYAGVCFLSAVNNTWTLIKDDGKLNPSSEFTTFSCEYTPSKADTSPLIFQLVSSSGDLYVKTLIVGEVISSSTLNENDSFGTLPEAPVKAGYKDGKWNVEGEEINSESKFTYGKDVFAYLTYVDATKEYASNFLTTLTCDGIDKITASEGYWDNLKTEFNKLDDTSKAALKNAVPNVSGNEIEQCIARYDFVVNKYGLEDFMNRGISVSSSLNQLGNNSNSSTLIIVAALVSITLVAGASFFVIKKKHR